jgi:hypothetical protein
MSERVSRFTDAAPVETADRRREPRFPASVPVEVEIQKHGLPRIQGIVFEVSRSGLRLELPLAVEEGVCVKIYVKNVVLVGEIRHCQPATTGFHAGIFVRDVSSPDKFDQLDDRELDLYAILVQFAQLKQGEPHHS